MGKRRYRKSRSRRPSLPAGVRDQVYDKYGGRCAYSGTQLKEDWQVDHLVPLVAFRRGYATGDPNHIDNLVPTQAIINHYKRSLSVESFRKRIKTLHVRLEKLPVNPRVDKTKKHKAYLLEVAALFGITWCKPFNGKFYYEQFETR